MRTAKLLGGRWSLRSWCYVAVVTGCATAGFVLGSPWPIGVAAAMALPASLATMPAYYLAYGLLALVPGANPSSNSGSGSSAVNGGAGTSAVEGAQAGWFAVVAPSIGVLALVLAAILNVLLLGVFRSRAGRVAREVGAATPT